MNSLKTVVLSLLSALVGGLVVAGIFTWKSNLLTEVSHASVKKDSDTFKIPHSEKELFENMNNYHKNMRNQFDLFFNDDFFSQDDPFEAMRKFRKNWDEDIQNFSHRPFLSPFDSWFGQKFGGGTAEDIEKREDENFVYYDIKVKDVNETTINTNVESGYLTITGKIQSKKTQEDEEGHIANQSVYSSSFSRTFPLPNDVNENAMHMDSEKDKIVIKFPKKN